MRRKRQKTKSSISLRLLFFSRYLASYRIPLKGMVHVQHYATLGRDKEPHMEVISPGTKGLQTYIGNRLLVYIYREFRANEKPGFLPSVRADELFAWFPHLSEALC